MRNRELTETRMVQVNWLALPCFHLFLFIVLIILCKCYFIMRFWIIDMLLYQALREELASAEQQSGRRTYSSLYDQNGLCPILPFKQSCVPCLHYDNFCLVKQAAMERVVELEHRAVEASTVLARMQVMYGHALYVISCKSNLLFLFKIITS